MSSARHGRPSGGTILVVDADAALNGAQALLEREGHRVVPVPRDAELPALLMQESPQLLIVNQDRATESLIGSVRERDGLVQILLCSPGGSDLPPPETLRRLRIHGCHVANDGPERLVRWVEAALRVYDQLAQLHIAERLKTQLLGNVSHEFRTPLSVIFGYVELLREGTFGTFPGEADPIFEKILSTGVYLRQLIEEFLGLSKLEAGSMAVRHELVPLTPFLRELGESFGLLLRTKPVEFRLDIPDNLPSVATDAPKLRVVIQNLFTNAEKFTSRGHILLAARALPDGLVAISVTDTGPGIAPEHHEKIFEIFQQVGPADARAKGVGLGLALARRFARLMDGDVTLESRPGEGSTFTLSLPVTVAVGGQTAAPHAA